MSLNSKMRTLGDHPRSEKGSQPWLRKASWLEQWKGLGSGCYYKHREYDYGETVIFFSSLRRLRPNCLSLSSTGLQIHLRIPGFSFVFLRLKKDHCWFQKRLFQTRRDGVNFDFKFKSSIFSSAPLSPNSRIRVGDSWRNCGILDKEMSCFFVFVFRHLNCELWISISPCM